MKFLVWMVLALAGAANAQGSLQRGESTVYYSAVPTTTLATEVARQYAITASPGRALLTLVVIRGDVASAASVSGSATNLAGETQVLALREVRDAAGGVSYLAEPRIAARDTLDFDLAVLPAGDSEAISVKFRQEFFPER